MKMKIKLMADPAPGGGGGKPQSDKDRIAQLESELALARKEITDYKAADAQRAADEKKIAEKMAFGLTRDQALAVIQRQKDHDAQEKQKAETAEPKKSPIAN